MKKLLALLCLVSLPQAYACLSAGNDVICIGDLVFKGNSYTQGARVIGENPFSGQVTVRSLTSGSQFVEQVQNLDVARGCIGQSCVNEIVYKGNSYTKGAVIVGVNHFRQTLTVRSQTSGNLFVERFNDVGQTKGCLENVCVGDLVYKGNNYTQGARVEAINHYAQSLVVRSVSSGNLFAENYSDVHITRGCLGQICVGDLVYKGNSYTRGATVLAINADRYLATVRSVSSGSTFAESIYDLQRPGEGQPNPPTQPPRPPVPPTKPTPPSQTTMECLVYRSEVTGQIIQSYRESSSGFESPDVLKAQACKKAIAACSAHKRGNQVCEVAR